MSVHQAFGHILDDKLTQVADGPSAQVAAEARVATPAFWGVPAQATLPNRRYSPGQASLRHAHHAPVSSDVGAATTTRSTRPRPLTSTQRDALRQLQRLGAVDLAPGFSDRQLRGAFRALAKRFHPDRHPASSSTERERLAGTFATLCDAYRELTTPSGQSEPAANHR